MTTNRSELSAVVQPSTISGGSLDVRSILAVSEAWSERNESALLEPFTHVFSVPGKEIRSQMIDAFNLWLKVPQDKLRVISKVVSMLHTASLLVDDIEDDAQLRRGVPVAHKIYGVPQTINSANYVYFLAYQELFALRSGIGVDGPSDDPKRLIPFKELDRIVTAELLSLHRGQGLELLWRDSLQCPTEEEYVSMVNNKTGGLLRVAIKLMMACSTENIDVDYVPLVNLIGVHFQIRDDYMNLQSTQYSDNKGFAEDLSEGKFSFPVVHGVRADTSNRQILNVLQKRPTTPTLKNHAIKYLREHTKSFDYTLGVMDDLEAQIRAEIARLGGNAQLEKIVDLLHVERHA
ncbi:terpenoid synthase [Dichomitus squalens]|uniref:(2E,6E)-farnesyl diphosphate synthase n=2 Tax=Dichomitus squalens TaxID=114155 RepID=A0A4Q9NLZ5_9APHY|nr:terpenoid synthase [Dichomitus squalens LYAD-421 SS1]EJF56170.1 terpenoid synthase [Dichomitus squalens LYAD-421 SS1]TBU40721.1 terpenoid synthase [Dichomitus squalens]TBU58508.1 terpenoid synthase [Dichomitus squalens]